MTRGNRAGQGCAAPHTTRPGTMACHLGTAHGQLCLLLTGRVGNTAIWLRMGTSCSLFLLFCVLVPLPPSGWQDGPWQVLPDQGMPSLSFPLGVCLVEGGSVDKSQHGGRPLLGCKDSVEKRLSPPSRWILALLWASSLVLGSPGYSALTPMGLRIFHKTS